MKLIYISVIFLLINQCYAQSAQSDTFLTRLSSTKVSLNEIDFLQAFKGAENYLKSLVGEPVYNKNIKINFRQTTKDNFQVSSEETFNSKFLANHIYNNIHYYLVNAKDTLSYFNLLVDSIGKPVPYDKNFDFSTPIKLILSFRNLFLNKLKINFSAAVTIGRKHGFKNNPFLDYESDGTGTVYWSFSKKLKDGKRKLMRLNAETGVIDREVYFPHLEE